MPRQVPPLPESASVVIVGGGVIGTSAAFHLAEAGVDVVLIERAELGSGSTSRAAGGVRAQFSDALNIQIAQRSLEAFRRFGTRPGWEIDFKRSGYLFVLSREADVAEFEASVALQNRHGVPSQMLSADEARALCPLLAGDDILAASFSPEDGHVTPEAVVQGYAFAARACGAHVRVGCEVTGIQTDGEQITAVRTRHGTIATKVVICAAGAWSRACGEMVGEALPVTPLRRQILFTEPMDDLAPDLPFTIDFTSSFYFHREGPGLLMGMSHAQEQPGFSLETTDDWVPDLLDIASRRAPRIAEAGIKGGWAGLYEVTPDHNAIIGESERVSRFLYATGFSGHGFLQGPAVGEILRDLVLGRPPFVDIGPLSVDRFSDAMLRPEYNIV
jgi:sarcosine oxidase subunit beta